MDLDQALVAAILKEGKAAYDRALLRGITANRLRGEGSLAFAFLHNYVQTFNGWPSEDMLAGRTGVMLDAPDNSTDFFIEEVHKRNLSTKVHQGIFEANQLLGALKPEDAFLALSRTVASINEDRAGTLAIQNIFRIGPEVLKYHDMIAAGMRGIQTPWDGINETTLGFWPEDLIIFVARLGVGKTWAAILVAHHAWKNQGKRVLFITTEVSKLRIAMRFYAAHTKLSYTDLTHGRLGNMGRREVLEKAINELMDVDGFHVVGGDFDFQLESVIAAIEMAKPDLVVVDGVYLLRVTGATRTERMANIFDELKRIAKRKQIPMVITTQLNREAKKDMDSKKDPSADNIAMSDAGGWNADGVFGLTQDKDQFRDKQMQMLAMKVREGQGQKFVCNWNLDRMDFSQIVAKGGGGGDADEKGAPEDVDTGDDMPF
jgi:KaiC/GvpD/RAD55 family RecA-like ATPase